MTAKWAALLRNHGRRHGSLVVLLLVVVAASLTFDTFASADNFRNIAIQSSFPAIVSLGMTFVIISGGIDLSVGSVFALGGVVAAYASQWGTAAALGAALAVSGAFGLVNGLLIARTRLAPFIVTLATLLAGRGLLLSITDEGAHTYLVPRGSFFAVLGQGSFLGLGLPVWLTLGLYLIAGVVLHRTGFGQCTFAIGGSEEAANLMGLPVARTKIGVYLASGLLAGLAGALNAARLSSGVTILGVGLELDAISAVVMGGTLLTGGSGHASGTLAGVLLLGVIQNSINQIGTLNSSYQAVISGVFLVVVVTVQTLLAERRTK